MEISSLNNKPFGNTEVDYPARVAMKVITYSSFSEKEHKAAIEVVLNTLHLKSYSWKKKTSNAGKYISYSFSVTIVNDEQLKKLYTMLNDLDVVKMLL
jgi:putative lipoic acid-binding regulatory protein